MSDIFKIAYTVNNKIEKYYVFMGPNHDLKNIKKLFKTDSDNEIFKNVFSSDELKDIKEYSPDVLFTQELIHKDDTIEIIKKKILKEFEQNISFQEIYLFAQYEEELSTMSVYSILSQDGKIDINNLRYKQFLLNVENISSDDINYGKDNYDYEDIQELKLEEGKHTINKPVGQKFIVADLLYPFATNPYNAEEYDSMLEMNAGKITSTTNHSLLMNNGNIKDKTIYLCTAEDVLKYAQRKKLSEKSTIQIYYPYLIDKSISTLDELYENQAKLKQDSKYKINDVTFKKKNDSINIFYSIYDKYSSNNMVDKGISKLNFIIHPDYIFNSPLKIIFKLLHASKTTPFIKYNPSKNQENIYRLYVDKIDITGKKIPYLKKSEIFKKMKDLAGTRKVSVYIKHEYSDAAGNTIVLPIICVFENDGSININLESKRILKVDELEIILRESINPIIEIVKQHLEQSGYNIYTFSNLHDKNIEIVNIDYNYCYKNKKIDLLSKKLSEIKKIDLLSKNLSEIMSCVSSVFNVLPDENEVICMRYIRVENYNEYDAKQRYIHDLANKDVGISNIILKLSDAFKIPIDKAEKEVVDFISSQQLIRDHVNHKLKFKNSPGFETSISITGNDTILVKVCGINNMNYLDTIPIYVNSLIRMTQDTKKNLQKDLQEDVQEICGKKKLTKEKQFDDYIASAEKAYPDNVQSKIIKDGLLITMEDDSDDEDDGILGLFGDIDDEENEAEESDEEEEKEMVSEDDYFELSDKFEGGGNTNKVKGFVLDRLQKHDKNNDLFVKQHAEGYKTYSRSCPANWTRQPIILTDEEKEIIDKKDAQYPLGKRSYQHAMKYGISPDKQFWYICPRYWDLNRNISLTEDEVKSGEFGGLIPKGAKKYTVDEGIYEMAGKPYINKKNEYIWHNPGLQDPEEHVKGYSYPCCFGKQGYWNHKEQLERRKKFNAKYDDESDDESDDERAISKVVTTPTTLASRVVSEDDYHIKGPDKFLLKPGKWGYLPIAIQKFFNTNNEKYQVIKKDTNLKEGQSYLLRQGVIKSDLQSFVACIANAYSKVYKLDVNKSIKEMKDIIINAIDFDKFASYQNGNLISTFASDVGDKIDIQKVESSILYNHEDMKIKERENMLRRIYSAMENFIEFLRSDDVLIDYTYLWDIICKPNKKLFVEGLNLIIIEMPGDDITNSVNIICPTNAYASELFDDKKANLILINKGKYYQPVYILTKEGTKYEVQPLISRNSPRLKNVKRVIDECKPSPTKRTEYKYKTNIGLDKLINYLDNIDFVVLYQVINYNGKVIGVIVQNKSNKSMKGFIPCYPSGINDKYNIKYIDDDIWETYKSTIGLLDFIKNKSKHILCKPVRKVIEDGLIVGVITETNQFIALKEPEENIHHDKIKEIIINDDSDVDVTSTKYKDIDKMIMTSGKVDDERKEKIKDIELEHNFYNIFRNTIRLLLYNFGNRNNKKQIETIINTEYYLYNEKIEKIEDILREITKNYISFDYYSKDVLSEINNVTNCLIKTNKLDCEKYNEKEKKYCMFTDDGICKLRIPNRNLVNPTLNNEEVYFKRMADELVRYTRINQFMLEPKKFLSFLNVEYNLKKDEIIILQSLLTPEYFENLNPINKNKFIKHTNYDTIRPFDTTTYSDEISLSEIPEVCTDPVKSNKIPKNWKAIFNKKNHEITFPNKGECSFTIIKYILEAYELEAYNKKKSYDTSMIKVLLIQEYKKYYNKYKKNLWDIFYVQGKAILRDKLKSSEDPIETLEDEINMEEYYVTNIDIWLLANHFDPPIPLLFINSNAEPLRENGNKYVFTRSDVIDYYVIIKSGGWTIPERNDPPPTYKLMVSSDASDKNLTINIDEQTDVDRLLEEQKNALSFEKYIKTYNWKEIEKKHNED